ncbi:MAG: dihydroorotate dehydrogenase electron transfer subunit [Phycisphaerae bacterium]
MAVQSPTPAQKGVFVGRVIRNEPLCREHWRFEAEFSDFPPAVPGQFVQILCVDPMEENRSGGAFLRRPFSIGGLRRSGKRAFLSITHRVVGIGTRWLSQLAAGDRISFLGPLGRPFSIDPQRPAALLVGGGIGLPPLIWLAEALAQAGKQTIAFAGARAADLLPLTCVPGVPVSGAKPSLAFKEFANHQVPTVVSTNDGSLGAMGLIVEHFERYLDGMTGSASESPVVYTCGPEKMLAAVAKTCEKRSIPCQVCMERMMGCGMGTCQSCVIRTYDQDDPEGWRYSLCCTEGPVFDSRTIIWE